MSRSSRETIYDYIDQSKPSISAICHCADLQSEYRQKNRKLIDILTRPENIHKVIDILHTTKDFQTTRRILGICLSPVQIFLSEFAEESEYTEHLLELLTKPKSSHRYVYGIIMQILLKAFDYFPDQMISIFNHSKKIYVRIVGAIQYPAVFHFASRLVLRNEDMVTFAWVLFAALMDAHGTGPSTPSGVSKEVSHNAVIPRLTPIQRQKAIEVLCIYFNEFGNSSSLYDIVSRAVPLMLQDASDDQERALVIRLGLNLEPNEALGYSVLSVVNCFKSTDILLQYSLLYIAAFNVMIGNKSIEFFVYRLLKRPANNFVLIALAGMIRHVIEVDPRNAELAKTIQQIIDHAYAKNPLMKSNMMLAFRVELAQAAEGNEMDPESDYCASKLSSISKRKVGKFNQALIDDFAAKEKQIMESNDVFRPQFNVKQLWKSQDVLSAMSSFFKTITRLPHLDQPSTISRPLPPPSPRRSTKKKTSSSPKTKNLNDLRRTHSDDEVPIDDDDDEDDGPHTYDPTTPANTYLTNIYMRQPLNQILIASDDDEEEEFFEEEEDYDDYVDLPEIDVQESFAFFQQQHIDPLTDKETLSEPLPKEELDKCQKPIPKLNPESPRPTKQMFLNQDKLFTDDKRTPEVQNAIPFRMFGKDIDYDEEEEYDYIYEYEDEEAAEGQNQPQPQNAIPLMQQSKISVSQPSFTSPKNLAERPVLQKLPGTPPSSLEFLSPTRKDPELEPMDFLTDLEDYKEVKVTSPSKKKVFSPKKAAKQQQNKEKEEQQKDVVEHSIVDRKYFRLQLDLEAVDSKPVQKPKAVMHRRVLVIEIPEKKQPYLFIQPTLYVERPEVQQQPQPIPQPKKLSISKSPRCFYSYDDSEEEEEEKEINFDGPLEEEIISF